MTALRHFTHSPRPQSPSMVGNPSTERPADFIQFLDASPTPFHVVETARQRLERAGFIRISEQESWHPELKPGGKYFITRNGSTIVALAIGKSWKPGNAISMVSSHTDSPCLRLKPISKRAADGFLQVGVETYGGGMWHSWFDRDLGVAGRIMTRGKDGAIEQKLVRIDKPICRIPSLAVHFGQSVPFEFNKETELFPIAGLASAELNRLGKTAAELKGGEKDLTREECQSLASVTKRHHHHILNLLAENANVDVDDIVDIEVVLYDTQSACRGGLNDEFIHSSRIDNLGMTYTAIEGLIQSVRASSALVDDDATLRLVACFDNEEIGSRSAQGADSDLLPSVIRRLSTLSLDGRAVAADAYEMGLAKSLMISADMAHSVHPNYSNKYEQEHKPHMNQGTVVKINADVRYATTSPGIAVLQEVARRAEPTGRKASSATDGPKMGVPLQLFVVRNDGRCGSTVGPFLSSLLGVRTVDVGIPQLSMHSIRETCGAHDIESAVNLFASFFEHYGEIGSKLVVDG